MSDMMTVLNERVHAVETHLRKKRPDAEGLAFVAVICNGCGRPVAAPTTEQLLPKIEGWSIDETTACTDLCDRCLSLVPQ